MSRFGEVTLIVGAGAHHPYGLPTAKELTTYIKSVFSKSTAGFPTSHYELVRRQGYDFHRGKILEIIRKLAFLGPPPPERNHDQNIVFHLDRFIKLFAESQVYSIDAYMARPDAKKNPYHEIDSKIGKFLIAYFVRFYENLVPTGFHDPNWLEEITNSSLLSKGRMLEFFEHPPNMITFNYDNLLEKKFLRFLVSYHEYKEEEALEMVRKLNILHVYGDIDSVSGDFDDSAFYSNVLGRIKVVGEERDRAKLVEIRQNVFELIRKSSKVYLLGFGYDSRNMDLVFGANSYPDVKFFSTNIGITPIDLKRVSDLTKVHIKLLAHSEKIDSLKLISELYPLF